VLEVAVRKAFPSQNQVRVNDIKNRTADA
jgi:hypothetical protein